MILPQMLKPMELVKPCIEIIQKITNRPSYFYERRCGSSIRSNSVHSRLTEKGTAHADVCRSLLFSQYPLIRDRVHFCAPHSQPRHGISLMGTEQLSKLGREELWDFQCSSRDYYKLSGSNITCFPNKLLAEKNNCPRLALEIEGNSRKAFEQNLTQMGYF